MEIVFDDYINKQINEENKKVVELQHRKVLCISGNNLSNKYLQSLLVNKNFISSHSQKQIKLTTELNYYYNTGLKFIKIRNKNNSKVNNILPNPLNWWLTTN